MSENDNKNKPVNVAFGVTAYGPCWAPAVDSWLKVVGVTARHCAIHHIGKVGGTGVTDRQYTHSAENILVTDFLNNPDMTHLFFTEIDMILPDDAIIKLLALDKPIAAGLYHLRNGRGAPCLFQKVLTSRENPYVFSPVTAFPTVTPFRVDHVGFGCVLFRREVFEHPKMQFPWFDLKENMYGSDMYFYTKVKDADIPVWVDPTIRCNQIDYKIETFADYEQRLKDDPKYAQSGVVIGASECNRNGAVVVGK